MAELAMGKQVIFTMATAVFPKMGLGVPFSFVWERHSKMGAALRFPCQASPINKSSAPQQKRQQEGFVFGPSVLTGEKWGQLFWGPPPPPPNDLYKPLVVPSVCLTGFTTQKPSDDVTSFRLTAGQDLTPLVYLFWLM